MDRKLITVRALLLTVIVILMLMLMSCSASWHVRQAVRKDPAMFRDTVTVVTIDTLRIPVPVVEYRDKLKRDTLIEYRDGETIIRYRYDTFTDTLMIQAKCPDQKVVKKTEKKQVTATVDPPLLRFWWFILIAVIIVMIIVKKYT